jgi:hypothetical protein
MPLLGALGRWLRSKTVGDESHCSDTRYGLGGASLTVTGCFVTLAAILALPAGLVVGGAYELVGRVDRPNALGSRGHWIVAIGLPVVVASIAYLAWRGSA